MTSFPHCPEHIRPILDEFLEAMRLVMDVPIGTPEYFPGPKDKDTWIRESGWLYDNFNGYKTGFVTWAIPIHCKNFPDTKYIKSPWTLRYLYERYKPEKSGQSFDELMDEALDKDRRRSKWR